MALARQNVPVIKGHRIAVQVPFANHCGLVTAALQGFGDRPLRLIESFAGVSQEAVLVAVFASQDTGSRGAADRIGTK